MMLLSGRSIAQTVLVLSTSIGLLFSLTTAAVAPNRYQQQSFTKSGSTGSRGGQSAFPRPWSLPCTDKPHGVDCASLLRDEHRVGSLPWEVGQEPINESFAGHFPIRSWQHGGYHGETSMFYWYFPAINPKVKDPPLLIWLQGGPGSSSMIGLFFENGPIRLNANMKLERREFHWAEEYSVLFIDQPVGTGYSYVTRLQDDSNLEVTDPDAIREILARLEAELQEDQQQEQELFASLADKKLAFKFEASRQQKISTQKSIYLNGYVKDERGVAADLLVFLDQFYERYPELQHVDLYLSGESYAGKYVPALAYGIMESNKGRRYLHEDDYETAVTVRTDKQIIFPLKGIALGNSLTDPVSQVQIHADHAYYMGLVTRAQADQMRVMQDRSVQEAEKGRFLESNRRRLDIFEVFKNATGGLNWYDIRKGDIANDWSRMEEFMNLAHIKDALNVFGPRTAFLEERKVAQNEIHRIQEGRAQTLYNKDPLVIQMMAADIMKSSAWMVSNLLQQGIRVLAYQGIFDFRDAVAGSNAWIDKLEWEGQDKFLKAEREIWVNNGRLAGYVTQVSGLTRVTLLGAGHLVPMDQESNSLAMMTSFVQGTRMEVATPEESQRRAAAHVI